MKDRLIGIMATLVSLFILSWLAVLYMAPDSYLAFFDEIRTVAGFRGWLFGTLLPISLPLAMRPFSWSIGNPIPFTDNIGVSNPIGDNTFFFTVLGIWAIASFIGGLSAGRGLWTGMRVVRDSSFVLQVIFAIVTATISEGVVWAGVDWAIILVATFFISYTIGGLAIVAFVGSIFGGIGGIVGKFTLDSLSFRKKESSSGSASETESEIDD